MSEGHEMPVLDAPFARLPSFVLPPSAKTPQFAINTANRSYQHQYANIYFVRLRLLRGAVEETAKRRWKQVAGDPVFVPRVLDVVKGKLCYMIGTVYLDMPLKPNVLDDIAKDHSIPAPAPRKYHSAEDNTMLEDESGRVRLVGERLKSAQLVTGIILGVLGVETVGGDFEVVDICFAGLAPQPRTDSFISKADEDGMDVDDDVDENDQWVALLSGLEVGAQSPSDAQMQVLTEYLTGETGSPDDQAEASRISRLIIAGNSLAPIVLEEDLEAKKHRKYGHDSSSFSPHPTLALAACFQDIARSMPINVLAGATDPSGTILPQQPLPRAMFGGAAAFTSFATETNPTYLHISAIPPSEEQKATNGTSKKAGSSSTTRLSSSSRTPDRTLLVHSGQPLDDMFCYLPSPPSTRLSIAEATLHWRHIAPTAPDTLWCHPYFTADPFIIQETPDFYVIGNQPSFKTKLVVGSSEEDRGKRCRIVLVPGFRETGILVLVNLRTLGVKTVRFAVEGMSGGGGMTS